MLVGEANSCAERSFLMEKQRVQLSVSFAGKKNGSIKAQFSYN